MLIGWAIGKPLTLDLDPFLVLILTLSVIHAQFVSSDGNSNWIMGLQLIGGLPCTTHAATGVYHPADYGNHAQLM